MDPRALGSWADVCPRVGGMGKSFKLLPASLLRTMAVSLMPKPRLEAFTHLMGCPRVQAPQREGDLQHLAPCRPGPKWPRFLLLCETAGSRKPLSFPKCSSNPCPGRSGGLAFPVRFPLWGLGAVFRRLPSM